MAYTDEQIQEVCAKVRDSIADFTTVQNASFTSTPIIAGMKEGKTFEEINADMWAAIDTLPPYPDQYGLTGNNAVNGNSMVNVCAIACGALHEALEAIGGADEPSGNTEGQAETQSLQPEQPENPQTGE